MHGEDVITVLMGIKLISVIRIKECFSHIQARHLPLFSVEIRRKYSFKRRNGDSFVRVTFVRGLYPCEWSQQPPVSVCPNLCFLFVYPRLNSDRDVNIMITFCLSVWNSYNMLNSSLLMRVMPNSSHFVLRHS